MRQRAADRFLLLLGAAALLLASVGCAPRAEPGEAIVLVTIDTLRADRLGCGGDPLAHTPHLDRVARQGTQWVRAVSSVPLTLPAHASILSGRTPPEHGARDNGLYRVPDEIPLVAEAFQEAGWRTAAFLAAYPLAARFGLARGFDDYHDVAGVRATGSASSFVERAAHRVNADVEAWLTDRPAGARPVFLWVHYFDPHAPYSPPRIWKRLARGDSYRAEIAFTDDRAGRLHARLREDFDPLRLVVTADHGEGLGEHDEDTHGVFVYETTTRVPLIVAGPGLPAGRLDERVVPLERVAATILSLAGLDPAEHDIPGAPLDEVVDETPVYSESLYARLRHGWAPLRALRGDRWKVIQAPRPEIYDLVTDPGERVNLAGSAPEAAESLLALLEEEPFPVPEPGGEVDVEVDEALASLGYASARGSRAREAAKQSIGTGDAPEAEWPDPKDRVALERLLGRAGAHLERGDLWAARRTLGAIAAIERQNKEAALLQARIEAASGALEEARAILDECLAWPPASANALVHFTAGQIALDAGRLRDAEARFAAAVEHDPLNVDARYNHGLAAYRLGRYGDAADRWREVLRFDPGHPRAKEWLPDAERRRVEERP